MGRRMKQKILRDPKILNCVKCNSPVDVYDDNVVEVNCCIGRHIVTEDMEKRMDPEDLKAFGYSDEQIAELKAPKKRGRPKGTVKPKKKKVGKPAGRSRKVKRKPVKKGNTMANGKRGRKATVGAAVLGFLRENKDRDVNVSELLPVYEDARKQYGKHSGDAKVEQRNLNSTLYIMAHQTFKVTEVEKKTLYRFNGEVGKDS